MRDQRKSSYNRLLAGNFFYEFDYESDRDKAFSKFLSYEKPLEKPLGLRIH